MDEDLIGGIILVSLILLCLIVGGIGINQYHKQSIELEKYKIEMEYKMGDVNNE